VERNVQRSLKLKFGECVKSSETDISDLEAQVDQAKRRNQRAEGVVARTAHLGQH
jgi:hypothetical protein